MYVVDNGPPTWPVIPRFPHRGLRCGPASRWNLTLGRLPTKDLLPLATMQAKVRAGCVRKATGVVPPSDAFWGPQGGPRFGAARLFSVRRRGQKTAPFLLSFCTPQGDRRVAVVSLPGESGAIWTPCLTIESGRDQRQVLVRAASGSATSNWSTSPSRPRPTGNPRAVAPGILPSRHNLRRRVLTAASPHRCC